MALDSSTLAFEFQLNAHELPFCGPVSSTLGFSLRKMVTVWVFHQARRQAGHFLHIALDSGLFRGPPRVVFSQTARGILAPLNLKRNAESLQVANNVWDFGTEADLNHVPAWTKRRRL